MWGRPTLSSGPERRIYRSDDVYLSAYSFDSALFRSRGRPYSHLTEGRPFRFRVGLKSRTSMPIGIRVRFHRGDTQCPLVFVNQELFAKLKATSGGDELYTHVAPLPPGSRVAHGAYKSKRSPIKIASAECLLCLTRRHGSSRALQPVLSSELPLACRI